MIRRSQRETITNPNGLIIGATTFQSNPTGARVQQFPDATAIAVLNTAPQTLTGKTIVAATNNVAAKALVSQNVAYNAAGSAPPVAGQILTFSTGPSPVGWAVASLPGSTLYTGTGSTTGSEGVNLFSVPVPLSSVTFVRADVSVRSTGTPTNASSYRLESTYRRGATASAADSNMILGGSQNNTYAVFANNPAIDTANFPQFRLDATNNNAPILYGFSSSGFGSASWKYSVEVLSV